VVRYRLLETIRAYAAARLAESGEAEQVRHRHLAWCVEFAGTTAPDRERHPDRWRQALLDEYDNLRAALDWGLTAGDSAAGRRLAASMAWLWHLDRRGRQGLRFLRRAIELAPEDRSLLQAHLLTGVALVADTADPLDVEYDAATRALEIATHVGDENLRALGLILAAVGAFYTDFDGAWDLCEEAHRAAGRGGNSFVLGAARALQAITLHQPTADDVRIVAASDTARVAMGIQRPPHRQASVDRTIDGLRCALGREAFDVAWTEGARLSLPEAAAYASRARGIRGRPTTGPDSLTPTEHEVVRLVVEGLTNPGIAARLFMSRSTVKTHLAHIFAKLGVANRTELATLAVRWPERSESCPPLARVPAQGSP
jgi:DNA-binding NarL/FixJ family response regulator